MAKPIPKIAPLAITTKDEPAAVSQAKTAVTIKKVSVRASADALETYKKRIDDWFRDNGFQTPTWQKNKFSISKRQPSPSLVVKGILTADGKVQILHCGGDLGPQVRNKLAARPPLVQQR